MHLVEEIQDCTEHADKCQALAATTSNLTLSQQCLTLAELWGDLARTRQQWLADVSLRVLP